MQDLLGMVEQLVGVDRIGVPENDRSRGHCSCSFSGKIRPGFAGVDPIRMAIRSHVLWPLPAVVVCVSITHLFQKKKI